MTMLVIGLIVLGAAATIGVVAAALARRVRRRSLQSRMRLLDQEAMLAEARIDALTRRTLQAMRDAVREEQRRQMWNGRR